MTDLEKQNSFLAKIAQDLSILTQLVILMCDYDEKIPSAKILKIVKKTTELFQNKEQNS